jgi:hypothetical protein
LIFVFSGVIESDYFRPIPVPTGGCPTVRMFFFGFFVNQYALGKPIGEVSVKKYIIDTNALIYFVTDRNLNQQEIVAPLFESACRLKCTLVCHQHVLTEFVFVIDKVY